ncbi:MAG: hypothetical protein NTU59_02095, partial [Coprothermobacterota bacterium]|nr:hypothetical protein [Coprothermobacterota bacterium]
MKGLLSFVLALWLALVLGMTGVQALVNYPPAEVKTEVWLDTDGSGQGELRMYLPPNADKDALYYRDELDKVAGITLAGIMETGQYNWSLSFKWSDFKSGIGKVLINGKRTVTGDIIKLSFNGTPRYGELTLHLPGTIVQTNGEQIGPDTVAFTNQRSWTVSYQSGSTASPSPTPTPTGTWMSPSPSPTPTDAWNEGLRWNGRIEIRVDGSGRGFLYAHLPSGSTLTAEELASQLRGGPTLTVELAVSTEPGLVTLDLSWVDYKAAFAWLMGGNTPRFQRQSDGSIRMEMPFLDRWDQLIVAYPGTLVESNGQLQGSGELIFEGMTSGFLRFKPPGATGSPSPSSTPPPSPSSASPSPDSTSISGGSLST